MKNLIKKHGLLILSISTILVILALPYYIFSGKLFIGGDDTRLFYIFPGEFIKNISFYSWNNFSSLGSNNPNQSSIPLLSIFIVLKKIIGDLVILDYLTFSLPLILGFIFFYRFIREINKRFTTEAYLGAIFYCFSPIIFMHITSTFLTTVWFFAYLPLIATLYIRFVRTGDLKLLVVAFLSSLFFSASFVSVPSITAVLIPIILSSPILLRGLSPQELKKLFKRNTIFIFCFLLSQAFWLMPFFSTVIFNRESSFVGTALSGTVVDTFKPIVGSTALGNIFYPLLNLPHREIVSSFGWPTLPVFLNFYDKMIFIDVIFVAVFFIGLFSYKNYLKNEDKKVFLFLIVSLLICLYFFTVNIIFLRDLFFLLGHIPGFVMFRNFYDKFSLSFVFLYATVLVFCLSIVRNKYALGYLRLFVIFFIAAAAGALPARQFIDYPLWYRDDVQTHINLPNDYLSLLDYVKENIPKDSNMVTFPLNIASYEIISEENSKNSYFGTSPMNMLTGVTNITGNFSFNPRHAELLTQYLKDENYQGTESILKLYTINYILQVKDVSPEITTSYLFDGYTVPKQNDRLINFLAKEEIFRTKNNKYILYKAKNDSKFIEGANLEYKKINPDKYLVYIKNLSKDEKINFFDSYHGGWMLFPLAISTWENPKINQFVDPQDIRLTSSDALFNSSHKMQDGFTNTWNIDMATVKNMPSYSYKLNPDGTYDIALMLYFFPQNFFYYGTVITLTSFFGLFFLYLIKRHAK